MSFTPILFNILPIFAVLRLHYLNFQESEEILTESTAQSSETLMSFRSGLSHAENLSKE